MIAQTKSMLGMLENEHVYYQTVRTRKKKNLKKLLGKCNAYE
jgi:hypothetical protein